MKPVSIIAIALFALVAACSCVPVDNQPAATDARIDIYQDLLAGLFSGLVQTTVGTVSNFLNQLISENPLGLGKRDVNDDVKARIDALSFLYDNILQQLFSGLVTNTANLLSGTLNNLIQTNPLGVGKRDVEGDLAARIDALSFLYDNILQQLFSGLVTNTANLLSGTLNNLIQTNPLGVGKREVSEDVQARIDALSFLYDNILQQLFSGLVTNTANLLSGTLNNLIQTNPLGVGKRDVEGDLAARIDALSFLYDNILQQLFSGLVTNTFNLVGGTLNNLIQTNPLGLGKRSVNIQQIQTVFAQAATTLIAKLKTLAHQALAALNDRQKLNETVKEIIAAIKTTVAHLGQELSEVIPATFATQVSQALAALQSVLIFWTSGLAGSLGPVLGPFRP